MTCCYLGNVHAVISLLGKLDVVFPAVELVSVRCGYFLQYISSGGETEIVRTESVRLDPVFGGSSDLTAVNGEKSQNGSCEILLLSVVLVKIKRVLGSGLGIGPV